MKHIPLLVTLVVASASMGHGAAISISPQAVTVQAGSAFHVDVLASDVSIGAFDLDIIFDPLIASLEDVDFDGNLGAPFSLQDWTLGSGVVTLSEVSLLFPEELAALQNGTYSLARLIFRALTPGFTDMLITRNVVSDPTGAVISPELLGALVTVSGETVVPEPQTFAMLAGAGLLMLALRARRTSRG